MFEVNRITALVCYWSKEGQWLGLWQKYCACAGPTTILCCKGGWHIVFMSSRFNNDAQSRYSPIKGECMTLFWAIHKTDYFIFGCPKLFVYSRLARGVHPSYLYMFIISLRSFPCYPGIMPVSGCVPFIWPWEVFSTPTSCKGI